MAKELNYHRIEHTFKFVESKANCAPLHGNFIYVVAILNVTLNVLSFWRAFSPAISWMEIYIIAVTYFCVNQSLFF